MWVALRKKKNTVWPFPSLGLVKACPRMSVVKDISLCLALNTRFIRTSPVLVSGCVVESEEREAREEKDRRREKSMSNVGLFQRLLSQCHVLSQKAGDIIRDVHQSGDLGVVDKGEDDFCTKADRLAQTCIVASLARSFPNLTVIGEETLDPSEAVPDKYICTEFSSDVLQQSFPPDLQDVKEDEIVVWVDPLDGTSDFRAGRLINVTVLIGVAVKGVPIGGVINQPFYNQQAVEQGQKPGRCIWGVVGLGVFGHEAAPLAQDENIITTTFSRHDDLINRAVTSCQPTKEIRTGGAGFKTLLTLEGQAHAFVYANGHWCCKWDTCAPDALLNAAGGRMTDLLGTPIPYHAGVEIPDSSGILATAPGVDHSWYVQCIPDDIRQRFLKA